MHNLYLGKIQAFVKLEPDGVGSRLPVRVETGRSWGLCGEREPLQSPCPCGDPGYIHMSGWPKPTRAIERSMGDPVGPDTGYKKQSWKTVSIHNKKLGVEGRGYLLSLSFFMLSRIYQNIFLSFLRRRWKWFTFCDGNLCFSGNIKILPRDWGYLAGLKSSFFHCSDLLVLILSTAFHPLEDELWTSTSLEGYLEKN